MLLTSTASSFNTWVTCPQPNPGADLRLFCFPYAGGGASGFRTWSKTLPRIEVCPVQLPGRENRLREPPVARLAPLIASLTEVLPPYLDKPYALFGHSLGALVVFELARALRRLDLPGPAHLFVSGRLAPQAVDDGVLTYQLSDAKFLEQLRRLNGTPETVLQNPELMQMLLPILRADFAINETYVYQDEPPLDVPISAFGGTHDPKASEHDLEQWSDHTGDRFTLRMLPGDHFFVHSAQAALLRAIEQDLALDAG